MYGDAALVETEQHRFGFHAREPQAHQVGQPRVGIARAIALDAVDGVRRNVSGFALSLGAGFAWGGVKPRP